MRCDTDQTENRPDEMAAEIFRPFWDSPDVDIEAPPDVAPEPTSIDMELNSIDEKG